MGRLLRYALPVAVAAVAVAAAAVAAMAGSSGSSGVSLDRAIASAVEETLFAAIPIGILQNMVHAYTGARSALAASEHHRGGATPMIVVGANPKSGKVLSIKLGVDAALYNKVGVTYELSDYVRPLSQDGFFSMRLTHVPASPGVKLVTPFERVEQFDACVWITRDPLATLVSHYTYIIDGGEHQILEATRKVKPMPMADGVRWVYENVARPRMAADKEHYDAHYRGRCREVPMEEFRANFTAAVEAFVVEGMGLPMDDGLRAQLEAHDTSRTASKHSSSASAETKRLVREVVVGDAEMAAFVGSMR